MSLLGRRRIVSNRRAKSIEVVAEYLILRPATRSE
jgi:hypothetical protein